MELENVLPQKIQTVKYNGPVTLIYTTRHLFHLFLLWWKYLTFSFKKNLTFQKVNTELFRALENRIT